MGGVSFGVGLEVRLGLLWVFNGFESLGSGSIAMDDCGVMFWLSLFLAGGQTRWERHFLGP